MAADTTSDRTLALGASVSVPQHVVYRSFPSETVVLNLATGKYHGLNTTAGRMFEALEKAGTVQAAAIEMVGRYGQPRATVEKDLCALCDALRERGLIEIDGCPGS